MTDCPTPGKQVYGSIGEAVAASEVIAVIHGHALYPYGDCPCGCWHLTSTPRTSDQYAAMAATDEGTAALLELDRIHRTTDGAPRSHQHRQRPGKRKGTRR